MAGVDLSKTIFANTKLKPLGYVLELKARAGRKNGPGLVLGLGACEVAKDNRQLLNTYYQCKGLYAKFGLEYASFFKLGDQLELANFFGLLVNISNTTNFGYFEIPGNFFDSYRQPFRKQFTQIGILLSDEVFFPVGKHLSFGMQFTAGYLTTKNPKVSHYQDVPYLAYYYAPGLGITGENRFAASTSWSVYYRF